MEEKKKKKRTKEINSIPGSIRRSTFQIPRFLIRINMPNDVIREADDLVSGSPGHLGETFRLGLVFEGVAGEIDAFGQAKKVLVD